MRLEAIEKEADLYRGDSECYIHVERAGNSPLTCVVAGDRNAVAQAIYHLLCEMAVQMEVPFSDVLKLYKRAHKLYGFSDRKVMIDD